MMAYKIDSRAIVLVIDILRKNDHLVDVGISDDGKRCWLVWSEFDVLKKRPISRGAYNRIEHVYSMTELKLVDRHNELKTWWSSIVYKYVVNAE